jgi:hypothetical protein
LTDCYNICHNVALLILAVKLRKFGNSLGIILPRNAPARLNVEEGETLFLTETTETGYRLTAGNPAPQDPSSGQTEPSVPGRSQGTGPMNEPHSIGREECLVLHEMMLAPAWRFGRST